MTTTHNGVSAVVTAVTADPELTERTPAGEAASGASIDKVREILFGTQVREFERRFVRLEERVAKEIAALKDEMKARLDALELYARNEAETLADQIKAEHADRLEAGTGFARELSESTKSLERRATTLDEQFSKGQRELRQQMLEQHQRLGDEIRRRADELLATLAREAQELRTDKTDRAALAALLNEMALRLTNDFRLPEVDETRNG